MNEQSSWPAIWKVAGNVLRASLGFGLAWLLWQMAVDGFELVKLFAALCAIGGAIRATIGLAGAIKLIIRHRTWARYQAKGAKPKADTLAGNADLKRRGLIR